LGKRGAIIAAIIASLVLPATARSNGDPASDYLLTQNLFLPFGVRIDSGALNRLKGVLQNADRAGFKIRVALILTRGDLGTAFSLFGKPQRYAEFLGFELSFVYRGRLLVVMPAGFGYAVGGKKDSAAVRVLASLRSPGANATKEAEAATEGVRRLAAASGTRLAVPSGSDSSSRDRITIAAAATAAIALVAAFVLFRRGRRSQGD
jgi:hypothetical protein